MQSTTLIGPGAVTGQVFGDISYGPGDVDGIPYAFAGDVVIYGEAFTISDLSQPMNGVGVYAAAASPNAPAPPGRLPEIVFTINWSDGTTEVFNSPVGAVEDTFAQYFAVLDSERTFRSPSLDSPGDNIFVGQLDMLTFGIAAAPVPAPAAAGLALLGLAPLALRLRRRSARPA